MSTPLLIRRAGAADADVVTRVITLSFAHDPLWSWALAGPDGDTDHLGLFWRLFVEGALRYPDTWLALDGAAASVWIPPGRSEMSSEQEERFDRLVDEHLGERAPLLRGLLADLASHHPREEDHYYLSLLGTDPAARGRGVGMGLLRANLETLDDQHAAAYLESSNPANDERYRSVGFEQVGAFAAPGDGPVVTTMWRAAR